MHVTMNDAVMSDADVRHADLSNANLSRTIAFNVLLSHARICDTTLPDGKVSNVTCSYAPFKP
jgi:uncharacterized protein YjbI with pentapeptide repeats